MERASRTIASMSNARRTALMSLAAALLLAAAKLVVGLTTGSLGVLAEAVHSGLDAAAAVLTLYAVGVAERPPDAAHQYGHGKAQHLAALFEALLLSAAALWIATEAVSRLRSGSHDVDPHLVRIRADGRRPGGRRGADDGVAARGPARPERGAARQRLPLRLGLRRHRGGADRPRAGVRGRRRRRRLGRAVRRGARAGGSRAAGRRQRPRADGSGADRPGGRDRTRRSRGAGRARGARRAGARGGGRELRRRDDRRVPAGGAGAQPRDHGPGGGGRARPRRARPGDRARRADRQPRTADRAGRGRCAARPGRGRDPQHQRAGGARAAGPSPCTRGWARTSRWRRWHRCWAG